MGIFRQHIPAFVEGVERKIIEFTDLDEVLKQLPPLTSGFHYCYDEYFNCQLLIESNADDSEWLVIGYVEGCNLSEHLPKFVMKEDVYESV